MIRPVLLVLLVLLVLVVLGAGCGQNAASGDAAETGVIQPVEEAAPAELELQLRALPEGLEGVPDDPESAAKKRVLLGIVPADDSHPRAVAELLLGNGLRLRVYAWRTHSGSLCLWGGIGSTPSAIEGGPVGPCIAHPPCSRVCLDQTRLDDLGGRTIVMGAVDARGEQVRLVELSGRSVVIPVAPIPIPGFDGWYVFAADLGRRSYGIAELYGGGRKIGVQESPEYDYETEECIERAMREKRDETECF